MLTLFRQQEFSTPDYLLLYHYTVYAPIHTHVHMRMPVLTMIVNTHRDTSKLILRVMVRQTVGIKPSTLTLAMKMPASKTALMCFSQPELSRPSRKSVMEGERSSQTATTTQLHHWQEATGIHQNSTILNFTFPFKAQIIIATSSRGICVWFEKTDADLQSVVGSRATIW